MDLCVYSKTSLTDHSQRLTTPSISIVLFWSQTIAHTDILTHYTDHLKSVPRWVDLERFYCILRPTEVVRRVAASVATQLRDLQQIRKLDPI